MSFPCTRCGLCCKEIHRVPELADFHNGDGVCRNYSEEHGCLIYDTRPLLCRIDEGYEQLFRQSLSVDEYYRKNAEWCNRLQVKAGLDEGYRIQL